MHGIFLTQTGRVGRSTPVQPQIYICESVPWYLINYISWKNQKGVPISYHQFYAKLLYIIYIFKIVLCIYFINKNQLKEI